MTGSDTNRRCNNKIKFRSSLLLRTARSFFYLRQRSKPDDQLSLNQSAVVYWRGATPRGRMQRAHNRSIFHAKCIRLVPLEDPAARGSDPCTSNTLFYRGAPRSFDL